MYAFGRKSFSRNVFLWKLKPEIDISTSNKIRQVEDRDEAWNSKVGIPELDANVTHSSAKKKTLYSCIANIHICHVYTLIVAKKGRWDPLFQVFTGWWIMIWPELLLSPQFLGLELDPFQICVWKWPSECVWKWPPCPWKAPLWGTTLLWLSLKRGALQPLQKLKSLSLTGFGVRLTVNHRRSCKLVNSLTL